MQKKLNTILLIDDNECNIFLHKHLINKCKLCDKVLGFTDAQSALNYLVTPYDGQYINPELILLDINMPKIDGWDFTRQFLKLPEAMRSRTVIAIASSSQLKRDEEKARQLGIQEFLTKPIEKHHLMGIMDKYFGIR